jgi:hypothetical protein
VVYCDPAYKGEAAARKQLDVIDPNATATMFCGAASAEANFVEFCIL